MQKYAGRFGGHKYSLWENMFWFLQLSREIAPDRQKHPQPRTIADMRWGRYPQICDLSFTPPSGMHEGSRNSCCPFITQHLSAPRTGFKCISILSTDSSRVLISGEHRALLYQSEQKHLITSLEQGSWKKRSLKTSQKSRSGYGGDVLEGSEPHSSFQPSDTLLRLNPGKDDWWISPVLGCHL